MSRPVSLKALDSLGSGSIGYMCADFVTSLIEHFYPAIFVSEKFAGSFYGLTMLGSVVLLRVFASKLEEWHILKISEIHGTEVTS